VNAFPAESDAPIDTLDGQPSDDDLCAPLRIRELQDELAAKDELVTALTVQLEQLAEQLDRLQRSGADRKRAGGGGLPSDVVDGHRKIVGDLERVVQQWEDMQAGLALGRLEVQITELRDFIADRLSGHAGILHQPSAHQPLPTSLVMERISITSTPAEPPLLEASPQEILSEQPELPSMWESLKSQMLTDSPSINAEAISEVETPAGEPPIPAAINSSVATTTELENALDERDAYISFLLRKLRQQSAVQPPPDWVSLENVPEHLCQTLESHTQKLEEMLRLAEIEMSIERARIGRERMQLQHQQESIDKQMRRLGLKTIDEQAVETDDSTAADRRWVRFLGLPRGK